MRKAIDRRGAARQTEAFNAALRSWLGREHPQMDITVLLAGLLVETASVIRTLRGEAAARVWFELVRGSLLGIAQMPAPQPRPTRARARKGAVH